jgi:hypothetical protein
MVEPSNQSARHASLLAALGAGYEDRTCESAWHAFWDTQGIAANKPFNERMLLWINSTLGTSYEHLSGAMQAYAESRGFFNWDSMNDLQLIDGASRLLAGEPDGLAIDFTDMSMVIRDTATPANNFSGVPSTKLTYSSPSTKWIRNASGLLESGTTLRTEYDVNGNPLGLLIEEQRTNLLIRSQQFDDPAWAASNVSITPDQAIAPDGTQTADLWQSVGVDIYGQVVTVANATTYTASMYLKRVSGQWVRMVFDDGTGNNGIRVWVDLLNGVVGTSGVVGTGWTFSSAGLEALPNGWYRLRLTGTTSGTVGRVFFCSAAADNSITRASVACYLWGAQLEAGSFPTSYIPTAASQVTRGDDVITIAHSLYPYSTTSGTVFVEASVPLTGGLIRLGTDAAGTPVIFSGTGFVRGTIRLVFDLTFNGAIPAAPQTLKAAFAFMSGDSAVSAQGGLATNSVTFALANNTITRIGIGVGSAPTQTGHYKRLLYLPLRKSNAQLQAMTAP